MNCDDYLSMLATVPVAELEYGPARDHAAECHDCNRVTRVVVERERNMLMAYGDVYSSVPAAQTATNAMRVSRRRKVSLLYRLALGAALVGTFAYFVSLRLFPEPPKFARVNETFHLQCLSPEQAMEIVRPYLGETGTVMARNNSLLGIIHVAGTAEQLTKVRSILDRFDNPAQSQCAVQVRVPKVP